MKLKLLYCKAASCCCLLLLLAVVFTDTTVQGQPVPPVTITGRVVDENGSGLAGASITVKGTLTGTRSGTNGEFSLVLSGNRPRILATYVGYGAKEVTYSGEKSLLITLVPAALLIDTVQLTLSTGYQQIPKERATGSFNQVSEKLFNEQVSTSVLTRLEAIAGGLSYDRSTTKPGFVVRGMSTIQGVRGPLIILDNFPYEGNPDNINPNDVASITVLKDAAAASIWGTKAGNGVIVITTKKGSFNQPVKTEFSTSVSLVRPPDLYARPQLSSSDLIDIELFLYGKGYYSTNINAAAKPNLSPVVDILLQKTAGTLTAAQADAQINALRNFDVRDDFTKYMYSNGLNQQYSVTVSGGAKDISWLFSSGFDRNKSELSAGYDRLNLRLINTWKPLKNLTAGAGVFFTQSKSETGKPAYGTVTSSNGDLPQYTRLADENGNAVAVPKLYRTSYLQSLPNTLLDWKYYPLTDYTHTDNTTSVQELTGNLNLNYRLLPGFSVDVKYQYERQQTDATVLNDEDSFFTRNLVNLYAQVAATTNVVTNKIPKGAIVDLAPVTVNSQNIRGQLNFSHTWKKFSTDAIAGAEVRDARTNTQNSRIYGLDTEIDQFANIDYNTTYPLLNTGSAVIPGAPGIVEKDNRYLSGFANAALTYLGRYTVSASGRRDASNLFGVNTNDKWVPLWSAGAAWNIAEEPFYHFAPLSTLKLRLTYGFSGNADPSRTAVTTATYFGNSTFTLLPFARIGNFGNPELRWERVSTFNLGLDFGTNTNRVTGSIEYYRKKGLDLFGTTPIDYTTGTGSTIVKNVANMKGSGWDLELNTLNTTGFLKWSTRLNLSTTRDEVTENFKSTALGRDFIGSVNSVTGIPGYPVYSLFSYKWAGLDPLTGDPQGYLKGVLSKDYTALTGTGTTLDDMVYNGPAMPRIFGSIGNTLNYKAFSVTAVLVAKLKYVFRKDLLAYNALYSRSYTYGYNERWQQPGDEQHTSVPSQIYPNNANRDSFYDYSEQSVEKADQLRLQYVSANWQISRKQLPALPFKSVNFGLNAANLGLLWRANKSGIDPDYPNLPPLHTYSLSLKAIL